VRCAALGALAAALVALAGCGSTASTRITSNSLSIYTSLPMRGDRAADARAVLRGEKLALEEAGGMIGTMKVGLVALDDSEPKPMTWTPGQAATNARQAAQNPTTIAYIGDLDSGATAVSLPITNEAGILQVSPLSGYTGLTRPSDKGEPDKYYPSGRRSFARLVPNGIVEARALASWLRDLHVSRVAIVTDGHQDGEGTIRDLSLAFGPPHVDVVDDVRVGPDQQDVSKPVAKLEKLDPQAVIYAGAVPLAAARLLRAVNATSPDTPLFATSAAAHGTFAAALGPAAGEVHVTSPLVPIAHRGAAGRMADRYRRAFGSEPPTAAFYGYEAMRSVLQSIRDAGSEGNDRTAVISAYLDRRPRSSVLGRYVIDRLGDTSVEAYGAFRAAGGRLRFERRLDGGSD
jgi:branched-chain amino acid transport system substrate-binding protein